MRLQKFLAMGGVASRRKAEELIAEGLVAVNGEIVTEMGVQIDEATDVVTCRGQVVQLEEKLYYILLNKPKGYVTTVSDQFDRPTVMEFVRDINARIYPVGRLDYDTEGLLLLTNDGKFSYKLTHPKSEVNKVYIARVLGRPQPEELEQLRSGVEIDGVLTSPARVEVLKEFPKSVDVKVTIHEGRNRQVRKMFKAVGYDLYSLKRVAVGSVSLGNLPLGKWRHLTAGEVAKLMGGNKHGHH